MKNTKNFIYGIGVAIVLQTSCNEGVKQASDTPTSGKVSIDIDESYTLLFDTEVFTFESLYKRAKIKVKYKAEADALKDLMDDSCKVIVINRELTEQEKKQFASVKIFPRTVKIAEDAVAIIVNDENPDTLLTSDQLKSILSGRDSLWI